MYQDGDSEREKDRRMAAEALSRQIADHVIFGIQADINQPHMSDVSNEAKLWLMDRVSATIQEIILREE